MSTSTSHNQFHTCFIGIVASFVLLFAFQPALPAQVGKGDQANDFLSHFSEEFINLIEKANSTWKIKRNFDKTISRNQFRALTGVHPNYKPNELPFIMDKTPTDPIPDEFDAREKWPNCPTIREIRDQGAHCGSCWAISSVEAMSDRWCIHSKGAENFHFSVEDLISCCRPYCGDGCYGGSPDRAWQYWKTTGIVSGGGYGSQNEDRGCRPYTIKPTMAAVDFTPDTPECTKKCVEEYNVTYQDDLRYGQTAYSVKANTESIQREILNRGSIVATFDVYADFYHYGEGVYQHVEGKLVAGHAVKVIGWGTDPSTKVPYWLVANSWSTAWGELGGFFKIKRGSNECGIESAVSAGIPKLKKA